jgi:Ca2+-binding RTX toxin-like protein
VSAGDLLISEVLYDPFANDSDGEWIEIHNTSAAPIDLQGLVLTVPSREVAIANSLVVAPDASAVVCIDDDPGLNGGVTCGFDYDDRFMLLNLSDTIGIENSDGSLIDTLAYDENSTFPAASGMSMALDPAAIALADNDDGADWCLSVDPITIGAATPGAPNRSCADTFTCDTVSGTGADFVAAGYVLIVGTAGNDVLVPFSGEAHAVVALAGNDEVTGTSRGDLICLGEGNDFTIGRDGDDIIVGGPGDDVMAGNNGNDTMSDEGGLNTMFGGSGDDVIVGGPDGETLGGSSGADTITGGDGDDVISGGSDSDIDVRGGPGNDAVNGGGDDDTSVNGDAGNDTVSGNGGNDTINGGDGDDQLRGGPGDDQVFGDAGDDFVSGNDGVDTCDGGTGGETAGDAANNSNCETIVNVP